MINLSAISLIYIDPAMTSYVIQIIAGVVVACGAALGIFWNKITRFFRNKKNAKEGKPLETPKKSPKKDGNNVITAADLLDDDSEDK